MLLLTFVGKDARPAACTLRRPDGKHGKLDRVFKYNFTFCCSANHTTAIIQGPETYETLAASFQEVYREINEVQADGSVHINGANIPVELCLGGDYKVSTFSNHCSSSRYMYM